MRVIAGELHTMDPARPRADAMALADGRIVAVGTLDDARAALPPGAPVTRAPGAAVLPGFTDSHVHMLYAGLELERVDLAGVRSVREILERLGRAAGGDWLVAVGNFGREDLAERRLPTRAELDAVTRERPLFVDQRTHDALVNTAALRRAGIDRDTPDPPGGEIERDGSGEPTGRLVERPAFDLVRRLIPAPDRAAMVRALRAIQPRLHALGLTGILDPGLEPDQLGAYQAAWEAGELTMRTTAMPLVTDASFLVGPGLRTGFGDERLRLGGVKVYYDGTGSFGTALLREPWPGGDSCGKRVVDRDRFGEIAHACAAEGWSLGVHAVGGGAIDEVLAAFADADRIAPIRPLRFTLIHAYLWPSAENVELVRRLGVVVALQPSLHFTVARRLIEIFGEPAVAKATPVRMWLNGGAIVAGGSDGPDFPLPPLFGIWQACTRRVRASDEPLGPDEAITPAEALQLWTAGSAYAAFADHERGRLAPGRLADWVALDADPIAVAPDELRDVGVLQTAVGGEVVHEA
jgi:predicted amidohydrolase YtcJ